MGGKRDSNLTEFEKGQIMAFMGGAMGKRAKLWPYYNLDLFECKCLLMKYYRLIFC
jgi:hypothetical protein